MMWNVRSSSLTTIPIYDDLVCKYRRISYL